MRSVAARRPSFAPRWEGPRNGPRNRPQSPLAKSVSRKSAPEWDALSGWSFERKAHPGIRAWNGMYFPEQPSTGNCVPEFRFRVGCRFRLNPQAEIASRIRRSE